MQEKWSELQAIMEEVKTMKKREYFLTLAVCALSGIVIGVFLSPKKRVMIGSNNGNNNKSGFGGAADCGCTDDCCCDDDSCCE